MWPTPQDYNEAIQSPKLCFADSDLTKGKVETNAIGLPKAASGTFASVYKIDSCNRAWAVRCFLTFRGEQKERYESISHFVQFDNLGCTVPFEYIERGIKVLGQWYPIVKMPWIDGPTMDVYISQNYRDGAKMLELRNAFYELSMSLESAGIAHGDLQHGNIIVSSAGLRLVDYDAFYVPALDGKLSLEFGHPNYQHPLRDDYHFDVSVDNFSSWLIYASLTALCYDPKLFEEFDGSDDCILFKRADLQLPESSKLLAAMLSHESPQIREVASVLKRMLWLPPHLVPDLSASQEELAKLPTEKPTSWDLQTIIRLDERHLKNQMDKDSSLAADVILMQQRDHAAKKPKRQGVKQIATSMVQNIIRATTPGLWVSMQTRNGDRHFKDCDYEEALACFLIVREGQAARYKNERILELLNLLKLATCSIYVRPKNQSDNYCLIASQVANSQAKRLEKVDSYGELSGHQKMYQLLSEFLSLLSRKGSDKDPELMPLFIKIIVYNTVLLSTNDSQKIMTALAELVTALLNNSRLLVEQDVLAECARIMLKYTGGWAKLYGSFELYGNFSRPWKALCTLNQTLVDKANNPILEIENLLISRACQNAEDEDPQFLYDCFNDEASFQPALRNAIDILGVELAMAGLNEPIQKIESEDLQRASDIVLSLWKNAVLDERAFEIAPRIEWLSNFRDEVRARCLDQESIDLICRRVETDFVSVRFIALISSTLRAIDSLGPSATACREAVLEKLIELARSNAPRLTVLEMFSIKRIIRDHAIYNSAAWEFGDAFHNQVNI